MRNIPELTIGDKEEEKLTKAQRFWLSLGKFFTKGLFGGRWEFRFTIKF